MNLFLDSGAFSADSQGKPIELDDYIAFIKEHESQLELWANLDVIKDDAKTWENQRAMEDAGVGGLPVFHFEDDLKYLQDCLQYDYFALGGIAGAGSSERRRLNFLDMCFDIICDDDGYPKSKVHGFGLASPTLLFRYPWYSFDSSSWVSYGRYGIVIMPVLKRNEFVFDRPPVKIFVTERSPRKSEDGKHFKTLSMLEQYAFKAYIAAKNVPFGLSEYRIVSDGYELTSDERFANKDKTAVETVIIEGVVNSNFYRDYINYCFYMDLSLAVPKYPRKFKRNEIRPLF